MYIYLFSTTSQYGIVCHAIILSQSRCSTPLLRSMIFLTTHDSPTPIANQRNSKFESQNEPKPRLCSDLWCKVLLFWSLGGRSFLPSVSSQVIYIRMYLTLLESSLPSISSLHPSLPQSTSLFWVGISHLIISPDRLPSHCPVISHYLSLPSTKTALGRLVPFLPISSPDPSLIYPSTLSIKASSAIPHGYRF